MYFLHIFISFTLSESINNESSSNSTTRSDAHVLVLSTSFGVQKQPMVIGFNGDYREASFEYGPGTSIYYSCAVEYQNDFFIFGGLNNNYQMSKINGCKLETHVNLPFKFTRGSCGQYNLSNEESEILLCFGYYNPTGCKRFDGNTFKDLEIESRYGHIDSYFSTFDGKPFIIAGYGYNFGHHLKIEELQNGGETYQEWSQLSDYPYKERMTNFATISMEDRIILFGSTFISSTMSNTVTQYKSGKWSKIGSELESPRHSYAAVYNNEMVMIIGGEGKQ